MDELERLRVVFVRIVSQLNERIVDLETRVALLEDSKERLPHVYSRMELVNQLEQAFDVGELDDLAFDVGINGDGISGETREQRARDLVSICERRRLTHDLITICRRLRPKSRWPDFYTPPPH